MKLDGQALVEVVAILDTEGTQCFSLEGLFEAALSVVEEKKVFITCFWHTYLPPCDTSSPHIYDEHTKEGEFVGNRIYLRV